MTIQEAKEKFYRIKINISNTLANKIVIFLGVTIFSMTIKAISIGNNILTEVRAMRADRNADREEHAAFRMKLSTDSANIVTLARNQDAFAFNQTQIKEDLVEQGNNIDQLQGFLMGLNKARTARP